MARPRVEINWDVFDALCTVQSTLVEIAGYFRCSEDTIERAVKREKRLSFAEYSAQKAGAGKTSLRRAQWKAATGGNSAMLIWLGKQYLGQREKAEHTGEGGGPVVVRIVRDDPTAPASDATDALPLDR